MTNLPELESGQVLPVMEMFYSIQGEGYNTGEAAFFVRIGGCDVGCSWCDVKESWNAAIWPLTGTEEIITKAQEFPAKAVVVTGGEPLMYNLEYLCNRFRENGFRLFLETSGSHPLSGEWDWICLSPKKYNPPLQEIFDHANELKVIIHNKGDFEWAEKNARKVGEDCQLFMQPEWSVCNLMMPEIVTYVKIFPKWKISLQSHKYMKIP
ncbi:MAG: 7-carboxy-7-deazaguanine synthase QueE [Bacteroidales bacterium]|nr:7-carboxy-7-deazaguanine synthase QueE [Bacteroidales bacterium]